LIGWQSITTWESQLPSRQRVTKMVKAEATDDNEYERQRLANIEKNKKLLKYHSRNN
jgi:hypothetical protein